VSVPRATVTHEVVVLAARDAGFAVETIDHNDSTRRGRFRWKIRREPKFHKSRGSSSDDGSYHKTLASVCIGSDSPCASELDAQ
jgi:hypothetical protein